MRNADPAFRSGRSRSRNARSRSRNRRSRSRNGRSRSSEIRSFALNKKDPTSLAFVKKSTIAQHLGISEATVYRALSSLESMGLIERERQQRTRTKLKVIARIAFTGKLLQYIGIPSQPSRKTNRQDLALSLAPMRDMNHPKQSSTKKHPLAGAFVRIDERPVPLDLAPLVQRQQLRTSGLFLLMRLARNAGHRLSDVVSAAGPALRPLRGRELFAYLKSLLQRPIDFGCVARMQQAQRDELCASKLKKSLERRRIAELVERYRGRQVSSPCGRIFEVDSASVAFTDANGIRRSLAHAQAYAWLLEVDKAAAAGAAPVASQAQSEPKPSSSIAHFAIEELRKVVGVRVPSRHTRRSTC
ncbi:helix-turn-helix transcriptional regulator [Cupriavidus pinatubonensis]|uniref:helix-turn-helix transcriptional regulator n=1 Tax=Cupriavidus pinatubonensis TaxID=248026 RepID=UPI0036066AFB